MLAHLTYHPPSYAGILHPSPCMSPHSSARSGMTPWYDTQLPGYSHVCRCSIAYFVDERTTKHSFGRILDHLATLTDAQVRMAPAYAACTFA